MAFCSMLVVSSGLDKEALNNRTHQKFQGLKNIASDHGSVLRLVPFTCFVFRFEMASITTHEIEATRYHHPNQGN